MTYIEIVTAKIAKEKGFDIKTSYGYSLRTNMITEHAILHEQGDYMYSSELDTEIFFIEDYSSDRDVNYVDDSYNWNNGQFNYASAPTQFQLQTWLRDKHNIDIEIRKCNNLHKKLYEKNRNKICNKYYAMILLDTNEEFEVKDGLTSDSYEELLEFALLQALKMI